MSDSSQANGESFEKDPTNATENIMSDNKSSNGGTAEDGGGGPTAASSTNSNNVQPSLPFAGATPFMAAMFDRAPNSKPREVEPAPVDTYVYRDFANAEPSALNTGTCHKRMPPQSLQSQKLPSKLAAMLSDPDLASFITWMPHGRSWKILNRDLFASVALPRYFGHTNHASFVRIVNAWGFRRIAVGVDRDSYYHELFLRAKPRLHERMKRLPSCHRKTPVDKDDKYPDFYELSKTSPLPEVSWITNASQLTNNSSAPGIGAFPSNLNPANMMNSGAFVPGAAAPIHFGDANGAFTSMSGLMGSGIVGGNGATNSSYNMADNSAMLSLLGMNGNRLGTSGNGSLTVPPPSTTDISSLPTTDMSSLNAYTQTLQRENENLLLKIKLLEYENQSRQQKPQQDQLQHPVMAENNQQSITYGYSNGAGGGASTNNTNTDFVNQM